MTPCPECGGAMIGVEIQGVYDGVLFKACGGCHSTWNRWDPVLSARLWQAAEKHRARFTEKLRAKNAPQQ